MPEPPETRVLLGYSARVAVSAVHLAEIQRRNLFKPRVKAALSVDEMIWPDVCSCDPRIERPQWVGYVQDLWASVPSLRRTVAAAGLREGPEFMMIAVAVLVHGFHQNEWLTQLGNFDPPCVPADAESLGFDVADTFLMSSLCNGTFFPGENPEVLRAQWEKELNDFHLFTKIESAMAFVPLASQRFPEHAPFFPFELFQLRQT